MPYAIFDSVGAFLRSGFAHADNTIPVVKTITWLVLSRLQDDKSHRNSPEPSEPCLRNLHQHAPELSGTLRNLPRPSGTNLSEPSGAHLRNLRQHTPEPSEIFQNLPGTCFRNLHHFTLELSETFRNLPLQCAGNLRNPPPEPTPAHAGTLQNRPPEPAPATRTGTHRSLSGLKTPLAYAVGEKCFCLLDSL